MQLRTARLCLDCEELHTDQHCPVCASDSFAYIAKWLPAGERPRVRLSPPPAPPQPSSSARWLKRGATGVLILAAARWMWKTSQPVEWSIDPEGRSSDDRPAAADERSTGPIRRPR